LSRIRVVAAEIADSTLLVPATSCHFLRGARCLARCLRRVNFHRSFEVFIGELQVVLLGHVFRIPQPLADDVSRKPLREFRLPRRSEILPGLRPGRQPGLANDPLEMRAEVRPAAAIAGNHEIGAILGFFEHRPQIGQEFGEKWDDPLGLALVVFGLWRWDAEAVILPIHILPAKRQRLGRGAKAAITGQGN